MSGFHVTIIKSFFIIFSPQFSPKVKWNLRERRPEVKSMKTENMSILFREVRLIKFVERESQTNHIRFSPFVVCVNKGLKYSSPVRDNSNKNNNLWPSLLQTNFAFDFFFCYLHVKLIVMTINSFLSPFLR